MYSEQLEQLIKSVIADGVITDKERAVLHKKAAAEGIDEDEIDVYVEGLIANSSPQNPAIKRHNRMLFTKKIEDSDFYYLFTKFCKISRSLPEPIEDIYLGFIDVVEVNGLKEGMNLIVFGNCGGYELSMNCTHRTIILETNLGTCSITRDGFRIYLPYIKGQSLSSIGIYHIDAEDLKMLADASFIKITIDSLKLYKGLWENYSDKYLENINFDCSYFQKLAQCFYREMLDETAYPDVTIPDMVTEPISVKTQLFIGQKKLKIKDKLLDFYKSHKAFVIIAPIIILLLLIKCV